MSAFGPSRRELWGRLIASVCALGFIVFVMFGDGVPDWRWLEFTIFSGMFFVWLGVSSVRALWREPSE
jgi:hypothetical protein